MPKRHRHRDGRVCIFFTFDGQWRHWDHPDPEPGPRDTVQYLCEREHDMEEFTNQPGDMFRHDGPTNQSWCTFDGRQWTFKQAGDEENSYRVCHRVHPGDSSAYKPFQGKNCPKCDPSGPCELHDRGEFGMPHMGKIAMGISPFDVGPGRIWIVTPDEEKVERVSNIMDEAQTLYKRKAAGYKGVEGDTADILGAKGQFADINRKFWRLKAMLWDEVVPMYPDAGAGESVEEILMDFIGHAALTIDYLRQAQGHGEEPK